MQKFQVKQNRASSGVQGKSSTYKILKLIKRLESHSIQQNIFQHYYQSYCDALLKMSRMDEEQVVFEQLTLNNFKKWSYPALKAHFEVWDNCWQLKTF